MQITEGLSRCVVVWLQDALPFRAVFAKIKQRK